MVPGTRRAAHLLGLGSGAVDWGCRSIRDNKITEIPESWLDEATSLQTLYMCNNLITEIPESWLDQATKLTYLGSVGLFLRAAAAAAAATGTGRLAEGGEGEGGLDESASPRVAGATASHFDSRSFDGRCGRCGSVKHSAANDSSSIDTPANSRRRV